MNKKLLRTNKIAFILTISFLIQGCILSNYNSGVKVEADIVNSGKRFSVEYLCYDRNNYSPLHFIKETVVKETDWLGMNTYNVYDYLELSANSFKLSPQVFLIIDNKAYKMEINNIEEKYDQNISENTDRIMTADSTYKTVVTGYTIEKNKIVYVSYQWTDEIAQNILNANFVALRYYAGPHMITAPLSRSAQKRVKNLIVMN